MPGRPCREWEVIRGKQARWKQGLEGQFELGEVTAWGTEGTPKPLLQYSTRLNLVWGNFASRIYELEPLILRPTGTKRIIRIGESCVGRRPNCRQLISLSCFIDNSVIGRIRRQIIYI